jgi:small subunit ribosomal protein S2
VAEAQRMGIPIVAVVDTNCNPEGIDFPIPGNDDAIRAITLFTQIIANAVVEADNEAGLKIIETLGDEDEALQEEVATDASIREEDREVDIEAYAGEVAPVVAPAGAVDTEEPSEEDELPVDVDKVYEEK